MRLRRFSWCGHQEWVIVFVSNGENNKQWKSSSIIEKNMLIKKVIFTKQRLALFSSPLLYYLLNCHIKLFYQLIVSNARKNVLNESNHVFFLAFDNVCCVCRYVLCNICIVNEYCIWIMYYMIIFRNTNVSHK